MSSTLQFMNCGLAHVSHLFSYVKPKFKMGKENDNWWSMIKIL